MDWNNNLMRFPGGERPNNVGDSSDFEVLQQVALLPLPIIPEALWPPCPAPPSTSAHMHKHTHIHTQSVFFDNGLTALLSLFGCFSLHVIGLLFWIVWLLSRFNFSIISARVIQPCLSNFCRRKHFSAGGQLQPMWENRPFCENVVEELPRLGDGNEMRVSTPPHRKIACIHTLKGLYVRVVHTVISTCLKVLIMNLACTLARTSQLPGPFARRFPWEPGRNRADSQEQTFCCGTDEKLTPSEIHAKAVCRQKKKTFIATGNKWEDRKREYFFK